MIGGNGYNTILPEKELFIRWMQSNVFMPTMQFSYTPWDYDLEVLYIYSPLPSVYNLIDPIESLSIWPYMKYKRNPPFHYQQHETVIDTIAP